VRDEAAKKAADAKAQVEGSNPLSSEEQDKLRARLEFTIEKYRARMEAARAKGDGAAFDEAAGRMKRAEDQLDRMDRAARATAEGATGLSGDFARAGSEIEEQLKAQRDVRAAQDGQLITEFERELAARRMIADAMEQIAQQAAGVSVGLPAGGARREDVGGNVGGGRSIEAVPLKVTNNYSTTVNDSYNPHRTAATIQDALQRAARLKYGENSRRMVPEAFELKNWRR
jgi:hypothetical protein